MVVQDKDNLKKFYHIYFHENYSKIDLRIKNQLIINFEDHNYSNYFLKNTEKKSVGNSFKASMAAQSAGERDNKSFDSQLFVRIINNYEFYILENKIILKTVKFKNEYLKTINKELKIIEKFITLDIETRVENNEHIPYSICYFDGKNKYSYYVTDFIDHNDMLKNVILSILKPKYSGYIIYVHNLSNFDGIFLINTLAEISDLYSKKEASIKILPVLRSGNFINIKVNYGKYNISFRDSYLLLPLSLYASAQILYSTFFIATKLPLKYLIMFSTAFELVVYKI